MLAGTSVFSPWFRDCENGWRIGNICATEGDKCGTVSSMKLLFQSPTQLLVFYLS